MADHSQEPKTWEDDLLEALTEVQVEFLAHDNIRSAFDILLSALLRLTESEYGFIGEVLHKNEHPYLKTHAISNIAWDAATRAFYEESAPYGMEFNNLNTLFGCVLATGEMVISNSPSSDPRLGGLPEGHPPLNSFMGIPLAVGGQMVGMAGIANRPEGYDEELYRRLRPFRAAVAPLIIGARARGERAAMLRELEESRNKLGSVFNTMLDGLVIIDYRGVIQEVNEAACRQFQYEASELIGENVSVLMPGQHAASHDGYIRDYLKTGIPKVIGRGREVEGKRRDGTTFPAYLSLSEFVEDGRRFFTGTLQDYSLRKDYEQRLQQANRELKEANRKLSQLARVDPLTGLLNRRAFDEALTLEFRRASRASLPLSLLMWDIDHFKQYNDSFGHQSGDEVLVRVAQQAISTLRRAGDRVFRYGGEEFVALLPSTDSVSAVTIAERLRASVKASPLETVGSDPAALTISCGVATCVEFVNDASGARTLLKLADEQLYTAKRAGRDCVRAAVGPPR